MSRERQTNRESERKRGENDFFLSKATNLHVSETLSSCPSLLSRQISFSSPLRRLDSHRAIPHRAQRERKKYSLDFKVDISSEASGLTQPSTAQQTTNDFFSFCCTNPTFGYLFIHSSSLVSFESSLPMIHP